MLLTSPLQAAPPGLPNSEYPLHALTHARVFVTPDQVLEDATLVISGGTIREVGRGLVPPPGARVWDCTGKTLHAGFLDPYLGELELGGKEVDEQPSPSGEGDTVDDDFRSGGGLAEEQAVGLDPAVQAERRLDTASPWDSQRLEKLRALGILTVQVVPQKGVFRGQGSLLSLQPGPTWVATSTSQVLGLRTPEKGTTERHYPASLMGNIALLRQVFREADWSLQNPELALRSPANHRQASWEALRRARQASQPFFFEGRSLLEGMCLQRALQKVSGLSLIWVTNADAALRPDWLQGRVVLTLDRPELDTHPGKRSSIPLRSLALWRNGYAYPAQLAARGVPFSLSLHRLKDWSQFPSRLYALQQSGLSESQLLDSLTRRPANWLGQQSRLGTLEKGKWATLVVRSGKEIFAPDSKVDQVWVQGFPLRVGPPGGTAWKPLTLPSGPTAVDRPGWAGPDSLLIRGATVWTQGPQGVLSDCDVRVENGRVTALGKGLTAVSGRVLEAQGKHLLPGLIDAHSHTAVVGNVNEMTLATTAMVDIADVVNPLDENIALQLAGGVTCAHVLHGSANAIGGRTVTLKWRWGGSADQLIFREAPPGIKFALGENPKQSNWGDRFTTRYPQTRQGVAALIRQRFLEARHYASQASPQPDEEMEALLEILQGKRLVHCHSYRQDEILMLLQVAEEMGFRVATLQHGLEAYKVADEVARHGAGVSSFSDWWAYKPEVADAIPYNGALLHERGVLTSFNSDSDELARRLLGEAAKAVRYGGLSEIEALNFLTRNPAIQLGIEKRVGTLEVGKDADFALWSHSPFDPQSRCLETFVEGRSVFELNRYREQQKVRRQLRQEWLKAATTAEEKS